MFNDFVRNQNTGTSRCPDPLGSRNSMIVKPKNNFDNILNDRLMYQAKIRHSNQTRSRLTMKSTAPIPIFTSIAPDIGNSHSSVRCHIADEY